MNRCILFLICIVGVSLEAQPQLNYSEGGEIFPVAGVEDTRLYYIVDGKKTFVSTAGTLSLELDENFWRYSLHLPGYYLELMEERFIREKGAPHYRLGHRFGFKLSPHDYFQTNPENPGIIISFWKSGDSVRDHDSLVVKPSSPAEIRPDSNIWVRREHKDGFLGFAYFQEGKFVPVNRKMGTSLHFAAMAGNNEDLKTILNSGAKERLDELDGFGYAPLHYCVAMGNTLGVTYLLEAGADEDFKDSRDWAPIELAVGPGRDQSVRLLLQKGIRFLDLDGSSITPIHTAIEYGHLETVRAFVEHNKHKIRSSAQITAPLAYAMGEGRDEIFALLLKEKAKIGRVVRDSYEWMFVQKCLKGYENIVRFLLEKRVNPNHSDGLTALTAAVYSGNPQVVEDLLEAGADPDLRDEKGSTPLACAASLPNRLNAMDRLIKYGADINQTSEGGYTPLYHGILWDQTEAVKFLLKAGADPNLGPDDEPNPLELATHLGNREIVLALIENGAVCEFTPEKALALMEHAFRNNIPEITSIALNECLSADFQFNERFPAIWTARYYGFEDIVNELVVAGADPDASSQVDITPANDVDELPKLMKAPPINYPQSFQDRFGNQQVRVKVLIDEEGNIQLPQIISDNPPLMNRFVMQYISSFKFRPAVKNGKPVLCRVSFPLNFEVSDDQEQVFEAKEVTTPPKMKENVAPKYPRELWEKRIQGRVTLGFTVGKDGKVYDVKISDTSHEAFSQAAIEAIRKWLFEPALKDGKPVNCRVRISFPFSMR